MPIEVKYPGVYVEELPSSGQTITGVSTSITAFLGRTKWGPVNEPTIITSFYEFQSLFGGFWRESNLGYSISDFFNNGGSQAVIVRLYKESSADNSPPPKVQIELGDLSFEASNPGLWGESLSVEIDFDVEEQVVKIYKLDINKMFNLRIDKLDEKGKLIQSEQYSNLTIEDKNTQEYQNTLRVDLVLVNQSSLLRYKSAQELPEDLTSTKSLVENGVVSYSVEQTIADIKKKIDDLDEDKKAEKEKLQKKIISHKSSDGEQLDKDSFIGTSNVDTKQGLYALEKFNDPNVFNILVIPPYNPDDVDAKVVEKAAEYCEQRKAFMIVDPPSSWQSAEDARDGLSEIGTTSKNAAIYFPRIIIEDPLDNFNPKKVGPSGAIAGVYSATDTNQGVWKAPAGVDAVLEGVEISERLSVNENGLLNPLGINCLRQFPIYGNLVWGARTLQGADTLGSEWKYVNVRRLSLYIEQTIQQSTKWAVFEPNEQTLWVSLRQSITSFLSSLYKNGAFMGSKQEDAFFVKVDSTTTTQSDIDNGVVNIEVGFAPLKPAEFIVIHIQQIAGQTS